MRRAWIAVGAFAIVALIAYFTTAREREKPAAPVVADMLVKYPPKIGDYERVRVDNRSAEYRLTREGRLLNILTFEVFSEPHGDDCYKAFEAAKIDVMKTHPGAKDILYDEPNGPDGTADAAMLERFSFTASYDGHDQPVISEIYFSCSTRPGTLSMKATATWPASAAAQVEADIRTTLYEIPWPEDIGAGAH